MPSFPTDNFYKFLFVFGIVTSIFSTYQYKIIVDNQSSLDIRLQKEFDDWKNISDPYLAKLDSLSVIFQVNEKDFDHLIDKAGALQNSFIDRKKLLTKLKRQAKSSKSLAQIQGVLKQADSISFSFSVKKIQADILKSETLLKLKTSIAEKTINEKSEINKVLLKMFNRYKSNVKTIKDEYDIAHSGDFFYIIILTILFSVGIVVAIIGGRFWYLKTQLIQDKILKIQYLQAKNEFTKKQASLGRRHFEPQILPRRKPPTGRSL